MRPFRAHDALGIRLVRSTITRLLAAIHLLIDCRPCHTCVHAPSGGLPSDNVRPHASLEAVSAGRNGHHTRPELQGGSLRRQAVLRIVIATSTRSVDDGQGRVGQLSRGSEGVDRR